MRLRFKIPKPANPVLFLRVKGTRETPDIVPKDRAVWHAPGCLAVGTTAEEGSSVTIELSEKAPDDVQGFTRDAVEWVLGQHRAMILETASCDQIVELIVDSALVEIETLLDDATEPRRIIFVVRERARPTAR